MNEIHYTRTHLYHDLLSVQRKAYEELSLINSALEEEYRADYPSDEVLWHLSIRSLDFQEYVHQIDVILDKLVHTDEDNLL